MSIDIYDPTFYTFSRRFYMRFPVLTGLSDSEILGLMWRYLYLIVYNDIKLYNMYAWLLDTLYKQHCK